MTAADKEYILSENVDVSSISYNLFDLNPNGINIIHLNINRLFGLIK